MALAGKLEADVQLKAPADKVYKILSCEAHQIPNASKTIQAVNVHEGDWVTAGSTKLWNYTIDGKAEVFKEKVEIDDTNKKLIFTAVEGHVLEQYKSYKATIQAIPRGQAGLVKVTVDYEKLKADDPPPTKYLGFLVNLFKDIDAYLIKA